MSSLDGRELKVQNFEKKYADEKKVFDSYKTLRNLTFWHFLKILELVFQSLEKNMFLVKNNYIYL